MAAHERIITVLNLASGFKPEQLPFDLQYRRTMTYDLAADVTGVERAKIKERLVRTSRRAKTNLTRHTYEIATTIESKASQQIRVTHPSGRRPRTH